VTDVLAPLAADLGRLAAALPEDDQQRLITDTLARIAALHHCHAHPTAPGHGVNPDGRSGELR
jgi:hypothetical protein